MNDRIYRPKGDRKIAGVCSGLGYYFNMDPVLIRAIFVIATICWGTGILAYIILWIIVPSSDNIQYQKERFNENYNDLNDPVYDKGSDISDSPRKNHSLMAGVLLIILGSVWLFSNFIPHFDFSNIWPITFIVLGVFILLRNPFFIKQQSSNQN